LIRKEENSRTIEQGISNDEGMEAAMALRREGTRSQSGVGSR
jgi:hypothetical protein